MYTSQNTIKSQRAMADALRGQQYDPVRQKSSLSGLAHVLRQYGAGKADAMANKRETANDSLKASEMTMLAQALQGQPAMGGMQAGEMPQFSHPDVATTAMQHQLSRKPQQGFTLSPGQSRFDASGNPIADVPAMVDYNKPFLPGGVPNTPFQDFEATKAAAGKPATTVNVNSADGKYLTERAKSQATVFSELEKSAESAVRSNQALDRFIESSANGSQGGAQPLISGLQNFFASFGFNPESLTNTVVMQQAVGEILGAKMAELGARGLTDKDMDILREALPRVETSHEARTAVANIMKKSNNYTLNSYYKSAEWESSQYPDHNFMRPPWYEQNVPLESMLNKYAPENVK